MIKITSTGVLRGLIPIILGFIGIFQAIAIDSSDSEIDKYVKRIEEIPTDFSSLKIIALHYLNRGDFQLARECGVKLIDGARDSIDNNTLYGKIILGETDVVSGHMETGYRYLLDAFEIANRNNNDSALAIIHNGFALYHTYALGDEESAMKHFTKGLEHSKKAGYSRYNNIILSNIVNHCFNYNDPDIGMYYAESCYKTGMEQRDTFAIYLGAVGMAAMLEKKGNSKMALRYISEAETMLHLKKIREENLLYSIYGTILMMERRNDEAAISFQKAIDYGSNHNSNIIDTYRRFAKLKISEGDYISAVNKLDSALVLCTDKSYPLVTADILSELSELWTKLKDVSKANNYGQQANKLYREGINHKQNTLLAEMRTKYKVEQTHAENIQLQLEAAQNQRNINMLLGIVLICCIVAVSCMVLYLFRTRMYKAIIKQNILSLKREKLLTDTIEDMGRRLDVFENQTNTNTKKNVSPVLADEMVQQIAENLEFIMRRDNLFANPQLTREMVAERLNTNRTYLSNVINSRFGMTFTDYVNSFRIKEAIRLLSDPKCNLPLKAIGYQVGFGSLNTFYKNFRDATGMTPNIYRQTSLSVVNMRENSTPDS